MTFILFAWSVPRALPVQGASDSPRPMTSIHEEDVDQGPRGPAPHRRRRLVKKKGRRVTMVQRTLPPEATWVSSWQSSSGNLRRTHASCLTRIRPDCGIGSLSMDAQQGANETLEQLAMLRAIFYKRLPRRSGAYFVCLARRTPPTFRRTHSKNKAEPLSLVRILSASPGAIPPTSGGTTTIWCVFCLPRQAQSPDLS